ncbi:urea ABC transporter substrate-binding protein [Streptomyces sp. A7024]|uniref:Urea ABC transporter substrate-binding protein n=1 Tax=Streptomyces coryli TaxID=1128680 RepID=A0A6G4U0Q4_9ACTN|nr:urea ABC transporter substrate-binding protein [Streptomyces coryli]
MQPFGRRVLLALLLVLLSPTLLVDSAHGKRDTKPPIRVGILHSFTGTIAISERSVVDAELLAIKEINEAGGVLGRRVEPVQADGRSDPAVFARRADRLLARDRVPVIFGCWTSASRRSVVPVVEHREGLLFYPVQYEGVEQSDNVVYLGAAPNQQIIPAAEWFFDNRGPRFFLVGSDYVFPRVANAVIKDALAGLGGKVVGEAYRRLGSQDMAAVVRQIKRSKPDVILNTLNGDSNVPFFRELRKAGVDPNRTPVVSTSIAEDEVRHLDPGTLAGNYAVWNYFQSVDTPANRRFVAAFKRAYGRDRVTDDPIEAGYTGVHLWARAAEAAGTTDPAAVRAAARGLRFAAPEGQVWLDERNQHLWKPVRIGKLRRDGGFDVVWESEGVVHPVPYPPYRTPSSWRALLTRLYEGWGGQWAAP